jgi:methylthioribulose-1-phosphate dehydratase
VGREFYDRGWSRGTSSNYSVVLERQPLELLITASGKDKGRLTRGDFVRVDGEGRPTTAGAPGASAETLLHTVLARHAGAGAVLHTHSLWGTVLSDLYGGEGAVPIEGYEMLKGLAGITTHATTIGVKIFENSQDIAALSRQVRQALEAAREPLRHGFLLRKHGLYAWGRDLDEARRHVEVFEFLFECLGLRIRMNGGG